MDCCESYEFNDQSSFNSVTSGSIDPTAVGRSEGKHVGIP